jgi:hypothetical protein
MRVQSAPEAIAEIPAETILSHPAVWTAHDTPWVARGLVKDWPAVSAAQSGDDHFLDYLLNFYGGKKVSAFLGEPDIKGRFFYNDSLDGFNFVQVDTTLTKITDQLRMLISEADPPSLYMGSTNLDHWLPGLSESNSLPLSLPDALVSLWLGNRSTVAPHFDYPANIACCVAGRRQFTLFPPEQVGNLYIGPWDLTPAGQPISLVDIDDPDLERFPLFETAKAHAQRAELLPGDAIYIPSLWWHQVESLAGINGLINYWWSGQRPTLGSPMDAFNHALMSIKQLPPGERAAWQKLFDYYVFSDRASDRSYWESDRQDRTRDITDPLARQLRAELTNNLRR